MPITERAGAELGLTSVRVHELALQRWLYGRFLVTDGYPIPVLFSSPMEAFSQFRELWGKGAENPFAFLLRLKDKDGQPLYEPYPSPPRLPMISIKRLGIGYNTYRSFNIHRWRKEAWVTVSADAQRKDYANVLGQRMPQAWDHRYQIDHWCLRPDTQAQFIQTWQRNMKHAGGQAQTWIEVAYPGGVLGNLPVRMYMDGNLENLTPDELPEGSAEQRYRTSISVTIEGYSPDVDKLIYPAFWQLVVQVSTPSPDQIEKVFTENLLI